MASVASVRSRLEDIVKMDILRDEGILDQIREARTVADRLEQEKRPLAIAYNLAGDLLTGISLLLDKPEDSQRAIKSGVVYYEKAADIAPLCIETAARHGCALIAQQQLGSAIAVLQRALDISDERCVHPSDNHIGIKPTVQKEYLITGVRLQMRRDLAYIKACMEAAPLFNKALKLISNKKAQCMTILNAAEEVGNKQSGSARARLLYPHAVLDLIRSNRLESPQLTCQKRESVLQVALNAAISLVADFPNSLVVSQYCWKLQVSLGFYDAADKEQRRALRIVNPDDPRDHEIPFGHTKGVTYKDRLLYVTLDTICGLVSSHHTFESTLRYFIEGEKNSFLSVRVDAMLESVQHEQEMTGLIHEAVHHYKQNNSWLQWNCPWKEDWCKNFIASTPEELVQHVSRHIDLDDDDGRIYEKLLKHMLGEDIPCIMDVATDEEGKDVFIIKSLDLLFLAIFDDLEKSMIGMSPPNPRLLAMATPLPTEDVKIATIQEKTRRIAGVVSGIPMEVVSPDSALSSFVDHVSNLHLQKKDAHAFEVLETLWVNVLKSCAVDYQRDLMALIAPLKWGQMKEMVERKISEVEKPDLDTSTENEMLMQVPKLKGQGVPAPKAQNYAFMYGHRALQPRINALSTLADKLQAAQKEVRFDPHRDVTMHQKYVNENTPPHLSHLALCSACYFERATRRFKHILHHFVNQHDSPGVKCPRCGERFLLAALAYHMEYIHNEIVDKQDIGPD